jgi:hypothetical protein
MNILIVAGILILGYTLVTIPNLGGLSERDYTHAIKVINAGTDTHTVKHGVDLKHCHLNE